LQKNSYRTAANINGLIVIANAIVKHYFFGSLYPPLTYLGPSHISFI